MVSAAGLFSTPLLLPAHSFYTLTLLDIQHSLKLLTTCSLANAHNNNDRYQDYQASDIPVVEDAAAGSRVRVMAGSHAGTQGPIKMVNPGMLLDVVLAPGGSVRVEVPQEWSSFAYVYDGEQEGGGGVLGTGRGLSGVLAGAEPCIG